VTKSKETIRLEKAVDGARRIIKPKEEAGQPLTKWLIEPFDDRGDLDLTKQIDVLKTQQDILLSRLDMASKVIKQLEDKLLATEKEGDRLTEELQLAEIALNPAKK
jgi:hypothetical protein